MNDYIVLGSAIALLMMTTSMLVVLRRGRMAELEAAKKKKELEEKSAIAEPTAEEIDATDVEVSEGAEPSQTAEELGESAAEPEVVSEVIEEEAVPEPVEVVIDSPSTEKAEPVSLDKALEKTRTGFLGRIKGLFSGGGLEADDLDELEEILYTSDLGPKTVERLMSAVDEKLSGSDKGDFELVRGALKDEVVEIFSPFEESDPFEEWKKPEDGPLVLMVVGVNGAGKTTTIGKLSRRFSAENKKVLIAAGDTFRAAASEQLQVWSERAEVEIFSPEGVSDPSAVAFDACQAARSGAFDVLIIDTAGRLHTQSNLMEELKKMRRVVTKNISSAPHEVLLVLDANSGQNALIQAKNFHEALDVTGVVLTKMDGSAKGGVAVGVACELEIPIRLIGVGEGIEDLRPFSANEFVDSIL